MPGGAASTGTHVDGSPAGGTGLLSRRTTELGVVVAAGRVLSAGSELAECIAVSGHGAHQTKKAGRPGLNAVKNTGKTLAHRASGWPNCLKTPGRMYGRPAALSRLQPQLNIASARAPGARLS